MIEGDYRLKKEDSAFDILDLPYVISPSTDD